MNCQTQSQLGLAILLLLAPGWASAATGAAGSATPPGAATGPATQSAAGPVRLPTSDQCLACHNGLTSPAGVDVSLGSEWRPTMMANSARDPYWQGAVRREMLEHPQAAAAIEAECSRCHMPLANVAERTAGTPAGIFAHLPVGQTASPLAAEAADGVSCGICHQILADGLGEARSFTGGFELDLQRSPGPPRMFGPVEVPPGLATVMRSATGFNPTPAEQLRRAELCATCHTLFTHALGPDGQPVGVLPEQVPYLEWQASVYGGGQPCQECHMPRADGPTPFASVLGEPRPGLARHSFLGANAFMQRVLTRHGGELGVAALPTELARGAVANEEHLARTAARLELVEGRVADGRVAATVVVQNLAGHKLPTGYPARRVWLHLTVRDSRGRLLLESGALRPDGSIVGNDNDDDPARYEPHHQRVELAEQVQLYEPILATPAGAVTTGLLAASQYLKDNRLLPEGFDPAAARPEIAVKGLATTDPDFQGGGDRLQLAATIPPDATGPYRVAAELWYQPLSFRWVENQARVQAAEPQAFARMQRPMAGASASLITRAELTVPEE